MYIYIYKYIIRNMNYVTYRQTFANWPNNHCIGRLYTPKIFCLSILCLQTRRPILVCIDVLAMIISTATSGTSEFWSVPCGLPELFRETYLICIHTSPDIWSTAISRGDCIIHVEYWSMKFKRIVVKFMDYKHVQHISYLILCLIVIIQGCKRHWYPC